jgi:hypothetical protein
MMGFAFLIEAHDRNCQQKGWRNALRGERFLLIFVKAIIGKCNRTIGLGPGILAAAKLQ